jgi:phosphoribosyl 1,2-cyclic phosphodiesterase
MQFAYLGSGSRGNAAVVEVGRTMVMLDCGFTLRETVARLARLGRNPEHLSAIVLTHEHSDHMSGVGVLARKYKLPVYATAGTWRAVQARVGALPEMNVVTPGESFAIADLELHPFPVPHDAREPVQYVFSDGAVKLGILTDIGTATSHVARTLNGCDALALECNHDLPMLERGPYPEQLKARIRSDLGHLDNGAAADLLKRINVNNLQHIVAVHLSEKNNTPTLARQALSAVLDCEPDFVRVAGQETGLPWHGIS